jgi:hypothetical protein
MKKQMKVSFEVPVKQLKDLVHVETEVQLARVTNNVTREVFQELVEKAVANAIETQVKPLIINEVAKHMNDYYTGKPRYFKHNGIRNSSE